MAKYFANPNVYATYKFIRDTFGYEPFTGKEYEKARKNLKRYALGMRPMKWDNFRANDFYGMANAEKEAFTMPLYTFKTDEGHKVTYTNKREVEDNKLTYFAYGYSLEKSTLEIFRYIITLKPLTEFKAAMREAMKKNNAQYCKENEYFMKKYLEMLY